MTRQLKKLLNIAHLDSNGLYVDPKRKGGTMKKASSQTTRFNKKALFVLMSILFSAVSAQGQAILSGDRSVPVEAKNGMVVTSHTLATEVALEVLKKGGNAIDAAVTAGLALAVTQPRSGNIGGGGFMLISSQEKNEVVAIDYREKAPAGASRDMFLGADGNVDPELSRWSHASAGVPGTVAGLALALEKYGTISLAESLAPAIELAEGICGDATLFIGNLGHNSAKTIHLMAEAMKRAYADRSKYLGDSDFVDVPLDGITSKKYAASLRTEIDPNFASISKEILPGDPVGFESNETTHFSIVDKFGNAVANTYTINFSYGSGIVVEGAGFLLNNEMDDFSAKPGVPNMYGLIGGEANKIEPHKRMLSSMSPTIVIKDGKNFLIAGSPGGSRIITTTLQVIMNVIDHRLNVQAAVNAPRIHHQWLPDEIRIEQGISPDTIRLLEAMGHKVNEKTSMGAIQSIMIAEDGTMFGGADPRRSTSAAMGF